MPRAFWLKTPPPPSWRPMVAPPPPPAPSKPHPAKATLKDLIEQRALLDAQIRQALERELEGFSSRMLVDAGRLAALI